VLVLVVTQGTYGSSSLSPPSLSGRWQWGLATTRETGHILGMPLAIQPTTRVCMRRLRGVTSVSSGHGLVFPLGVVCVRTSLGVYASTVLTCLCGMRSTTQLRCCAGGECNVPFARRFYTPASIKGNCGMPCDSSAL
jgi:hypothetical protein